MVIKTVSVMQPWATLIATGAKRIETRSWPAKYRGPLAIHASKGFPRENQDLCEQEHFKSALSRAGIKDPAELPLGAVVAFCQLDAVWKVEKEHWIPQDQIPFGDFTPGRYAWDLKGVNRLPEPVPVNGRLGLWDWVVPEDVLHYLMD
ncbi:MAG: ASCH domain-containing protein [Bacillota bacterium]